MRKILGYLVTTSQPMVLASARVLWMGRTATLFPSLRDARNACNRTKRYAAKRGYQWDTDYRFVPVVAVPKEEK